MKPGASRLRFGPLASPPGPRVTVTDDIAFAVAPRISEDEGARRARERVQEGLLRPADSHRADIEAVTLVWVPLWRVDAMVEGFHLGVRAVTDQKGRVRSVLPTGGTRFNDAVMVLPARRVLAFDPSPKVTLAIGDLTPRRDLTLDGEVLDPDVPRDAVEAEVGDRLRRRVVPSGALVSTFEVRVRSALLVHYPLWLRRYRYEGEAVGAEGTVEGHVAVSARDGRVLSERHPSAVRSLAGRVRRLFRRSG